MTHLRSLSAVLFTLSLSACWPYLGDPYESYVDGSSGSDSSDVDQGELNLVGQVMWGEQRGTYWGKGRSTANSQVARLFSSSSMVERAQRWRDSRVGMATARQASW